MKNTICEKLMWSAMTPAIFKYIAANCKNTDTFRVKKKSRKNFKDMLARTPDIGGFTKNPLRICLSGGIVWMAVYKAMDGAMSHEQFGEMVTATMQASLIKKAFGSKNPFDMEYQKKESQEGQNCKCHIRQRIQLDDGDDSRKGCRRIHHQLSQVRPVCAWKTGAFGRTDTLYVCHGFYFC